MRCRARLLIGGIGLFSWRKRLARAVLALAGSGSCLEAAVMVDDAILLSYY